MKKRFGSKNKQQNIGPKESVSLANLKPGQAADIVALSGSPEMQRRLLDMGINPGEAIVMERQAPFKGPIIIRLSGFSIGLRRGEADKVWVKIT